MLTLKDRMNIKIKNDCGRAYKKALLKRKLKLSNKKKLVSSQKFIQLSHDDFNTKLFELCSEKQHDLRKILMKRYYNNITIENSKKTSKTPQIEKEHIKKHILDEIGHVYELDEDKKILEFNLKKVATHGVVQLFNAINQYKPTIKFDKKTISQPIENINKKSDENIDDEKLDENIKPNNSLMEVLRRRSIISNNAK